MTDQTFNLPQDATTTEDVQRLRISKWALRIGTGIVALLLGLLLTNLDDPRAAFANFTTRFLGIFIEAVPFLLLGTLVSGLIEIFVSRDTLLRLIPSNRYAATVGGTFLGMIFPVCECGVVPVARRLFVKGLPVSVGIAFLLAAPFMNPIVFASTFIAFGFGEIFIGRFIITAVVAITIGVLFAIFAKPHNTLQHEVVCSIKEHKDAESGHSHKPPKLIPGSLHAIRHASDELFDMGRFLVIGSMMAAGMQTLVPQEILLSLGEGPVLSVFFMQVLAFVLSVCSTVDSFLALAFVNTFTTGSILAFLSFGPMVDVKSTMMFLGVFKRHIVVLLVLLPFLLNFLIGVGINLWLVG